MSSRRLSCSVRSLSLAVSAAWTRARSSRSSRATTWNFVRVADVTRPLRRAASTSWTARAITDMTSSGSRRRRRSRGALRRALVWGWPRRAKNFLLRRRRHGRRGSSAAVGRWASRSRTACAGRCGHRSTVSRHLSQRPGVATSSVQRRSDHCDGTGWRPVWALRRDQHVARSPSGHTESPRRDGVRAYHRPMVGRSVVVVGYPGAELLDIACITTALDVANRAGAAYEVRTVAHGGRAISCQSGLTLQCQGALERIRGPLDTLIVSGGLGHEAAAADARARGARPAAGAGEPAGGVRVHGGHGPGRRRTARRPPRHHALASGPRGSPGDTPRYGSTRHPSSCATVPCRPPPVSPARSTSPSRSSRRTTEAISPGWWPAAW